ncbi:hypothetical protein VKT23_007474 [Stygiomarasmius scandens]|uniref:Uncharacterized protein n=1 Tax=Marasmiellus scandens TaxID=2682957 RepID=A0ABR1JJZ3_9AGAR
MDAFVSSSPSCSSSVQLKSPTQYMSNDDPDSYFESDSYDTPNDSEFIPPRPTSRLGFHDIGGSSQVRSHTKSRRSHSRSRSTTFKWTRSLFQKMGFDSSLSANNRNVGCDREPNHYDGQVQTATTTHVHDISAEEDTYTRAVSPSPSCSSLENIPLEDISFTLSSSGSDSDSDSDLSDSDLDLDSLLDMDEDPREPCPAVPPTTSITAIAATSFCTISDNAPAVSSSHSSAVSDELEHSPSSASAPQPRISTKYSCLPSPLSPHYRSSSDTSASTQPSTPAPQLIPARHDYDHHGHSLHSLQHQKWYWSMREEAWAEYAVYVTSSKSCDAYDGIKTSPEKSFVEKFPSLFGISSKTATTSSTLLTVSSTPEASPPPMTLHPRWGDLSSLRDAWCVHLDRYFVDLPLWSIRKALWMADVHSCGRSRLCGSMLPDVSEAIPGRSRRFGLGSNVDDDDETSTVDESSSDVCDDDEEDEDDGDMDCDTDSMRMSMLTGFSDDSDVTLVDQDDEQGVDDDSGDNHIDSVGRIDEGERTVTIRDFDPNLDGEEEFFEDVCLEDLDQRDRSFIVSDSASTSALGPLGLGLSAMSSTSSSSLCYLASSSSATSCSVSASSSLGSGLGAYFASTLGEGSPPQVHFSYMPLPPVSQSRSRSKKVGKRKPDSKDLQTQKFNTQMHHWPTSWYARSEVLLQLARRDREAYVSKMQVGPEVVSGSALASSSSSSKILCA